MTPDEQKQFLDRMKSNGRDTSAFEALVAKAPAGKQGAAPAGGKSTALTPKYGTVTGETIHALFAPLPVV